MRTTRRVEDDMRPLVKSAIHSSAQARRVKKSELDPKSKKASNSKDTLRPPDSLSNHDDRPTEFRKSSTSVPRRLNDVVQAPPELKPLSRGFGKDLPKATGNRDGVLSMKQKLMMEEEREKVIARYRQLKEQRRMICRGDERGIGDDTKE